MERVAPKEEAFGKPGIEPRWTKIIKAVAGETVSELHTRRAP
jgi:hypothetical protein